MFFLSIGWNLRIRNFIINNLESNHVSTIFLRIVNLVSNDKDFYPFVYAAHECHNAVEWSVCPCASNQNFIALI